MIISVSTHKGGAGKTTIATNLAACIAQLEPNKTVLLIDLDGQCGVSITFGKSPKKYTDKSILSVINQSLKLNDVVNNINKQQVDNLTIIYSEPSLRAFDHIINENIKIQDNLTKVLQFLNSKFDYVIIDTPPAFSTINVLTFLESDMIISPFEPERQNIEGSLAVINELKKPHYKNNPFIYLLPIKVKERTLIDKTLLEYMDDVINIEFKDNPKIIMSEYRIPNSTQYKSVVAKEKVPLILSNAKTKAIDLQKILILEITKEILSLINKQQARVNSEKEIVKVKLQQNDLDKNSNKIEKDSLTKEVKSRKNKQELEQLLKIDQIINDDKYDKWISEIESKYTKSKRKTK